MNPNFFFVAFDVADEISKIKSDYGIDFGGVCADIKELGHYQKSSLKSVALDLFSSFTYIRKTVGSSPLSSITKNGISGASTVSFNPATSIYDISVYGRTIKTTVTDKATVVDQWIHDINDLYAPNSSVIVCFDVEYKPQSDKPATLHLCIDDKCLILQLLYMDNLPLSLNNFLSMNPNFFFVGFKAASDINKNITYYYYGLKLGGIYANITELAMQKWPGRFQRPVLKDLAMGVVGMSMKKPKLVNLSNWEARVLSIEQFEYGCIDAYASYM
ncbi:hypothetical protein PIB30_075193 [Stylosanthes scabra]|uniref:3'-5' exonuclease domain-containing protein n=1 Tax=Stylosanthes scabra TaxID=79078 RepID=A0ABU6XMU8_9FABA|nr:hypothetical protein [Stylosanthes scabra]